MENEQPPVTPDAIPPSLPPAAPQIAGFWRRVLALFIDSLVLGALGAILGFFLFDWFVSLGGWGRLVGFCIALTYFGLLNSRIGNGQTIGKRIARTRVVSRDGRPIALGRSILRYLVLGVPFFLNNALIPQRFLFSWVGNLFSILVFGCGGAIIYLIVFNRRTRQSLHDLVAGTFVVRQIPAATPVQRTTWRGHYVVVAILIVIAAVLPQLLSPLVNGEFFKPLLAAQRQIENELGVRVPTITEGSGITFGQNGSRTSTLNVSVITPTKPADYGVVANQVADVLFRVHPRAHQKDRIIIRVSYGYDIGISSWWQWFNYNYTPAEWDGRIRSNSRAFVLPRGYANLVLR
jgi:uncharacterized RDD family membrane protein YckC